MEIKTVEFVQSASRGSQLPHDVQPQIAFVGRSNVGKSSLLNTLANRRRLAHVNDYCGRFHGIRLCYGHATGFNTYGRDDSPRGARVITLREGVPEFETRLVLER